MLKLFLFPILADSSGTIVSKDDFMAKLFPNPWDALAILLAFIVLVLIAFFVAYKPVKEILKKRHEYVENKISEAEKKEKEAERTLKLANEEISKSKKEGISIISKAKEDAIKEKERIKQEAKADADLEIKRAKEAIAQEIAKSQDEIHKEIVDVAFEASKKVLSREISKSDNDRLVDEFVATLTKKE